MRAPKPVCPRFATPFPTVRSGATAVPISNGQDSSFASRRKATPPPSLRGALATKQPRSRVMRAPGLLRCARNDGLEVSSAVASRGLNEAGRSALAPDFRLLEIGGGDRPVERRAQFPCALERQFDAGARAGFEAGVDEVERDDVGQGGVTRVVIGDHRPCQRKPLVAPVRHALYIDDLDDGGAHGRVSYFARCLPKKPRTLLHPSIACSGR